MMMESYTTSDNIDDLFCGLNLKNAGLEKILTLLKLVILPNGTSRTLDEELRKNTEQLHTTKVHYFEQEILYGTVKLMCFESRQGVEGVDKIINMAKLVLVDREAEQSLKCLKIDDIGEDRHDGNLFNLTGIKNKTLTAKEAHVLKNLVSDVICNRAMDLTKYYGQLVNPIQAAFTQPEISKELWLSKASRLSAIVESKKIELSEQEVNKRLAERQNFIAIRDYYKVLMKVVRSLWKLGELISNHDADLVDAKEMQIEIKAVIGKLQLLKLEILVDIYPADVIAAHKKIRHHLEMALEKVQTDKTRTQGVLATYQAASSEFAAIAAEYTEVLDQIKTDRWMLDKLLGDAEN